MLWRLQAELAVEKFEETREVGALIIVMVRQIPREFFPEIVFIRDFRGTVSERMLRCAVPQTLLCHDEAFHFCIRNVELGGAWQYLARKRHVAQLPRIPLPFGCVKHCFLCYSLLKYHHSTS